MTFLHPPLLDPRMGRRGSTICMVTHDARFAGVAQRTVHLFDGRVVSEGEAAKQHVP